MIQNNSELHNFETLGNAEDLSGQTFGLWNVLGYKGKQLWLCECQCSKHTLRIKRAYDLKNGLTKSCGCTRISKLSHNDLVGNTFGDMYVNKSVGRGKYECICKCNAIKVMTGNDIRRKSGIRCNHFDLEKYTQYIGKDFGDLHVLDIKGAKAICRCKCGKIIEYYISRLIKGTKKSCGCLRDRKSKLLVGNTYGYLTVEEYIGNGEYKCRCICNNVVTWRTGNLLSDGEHSCGCMTKYSISKSKDILNNKNRSMEQITALHCKENLENFIVSNLGDKEMLSYEQLTKLLGLGRSSVSYYIYKYDLGKYIIDSTFYSNPERELGDYIENLGLKVIRHNKKLIPGKEIDIYIPDLNIAFEFNGTYWHSDLHKDKYYHQNKTLECAKRGIRLIHIFEYEWENDNIKIKEFIKHMLLNNKIVYARNCKICNITVDEEKKFLDEYHLQKYTKSDISIALQYKDELVAIMTLGKPRFNNKYEYEIIRYCTKNGIHIIGGAEKLFKHFIDKYKPKSTITYSDISKFTGNIYLKLGFKPIQPNPITEPNYVWVTNTNIVSRYQAQKHKLVKQGLGTNDETEDIIMSKLGYMRVYDSGNIKLEWRIN